MRVGAAASFLAAAAIAADSRSRMKPLFRGTMICALAAALGCGRPASKDDEGGAEVTITVGTPGSSATIGADGGEVLLGDGATLTFPPGTLTAATGVEISPSALTPPAPMQPLSAAYALLPSGLTFPGPRPTLEVPIPSGTTVAVVYLLRADGSGWDLMGGATWNGSVKVELPRLGTAFAAAPQ